jgi:hypothetical protein
MLPDPENTLARAGSGVFHSKLYSGRGTDIPPLKPSFARRGQTSRDPFILILSGIVTGATPCYRIPKTRLRVPVRAAPSSLSLVEPSLGPRHATGSRKHARCLACRIGRHSKLFYERKGMSDPHPPFKGFAPYPITASSTGDQLPYSPRNFRNRRRKSRSGPCPLRCGLRCGWLSG